MKAPALALIAAVLLSAPVAAETQTAMSDALRAVNARDWPAAQAAAAQSGPIAQALVDWHRLRAGQGSFAEYLAFETTHPDWPGMDLLVQRAEAAMSTATPDQVLAWFSDRQPQSFDAAQALIAALAAAGRGDDAAAMTERVWITLPMTAAEELAFQTAHPGLLAAQHDARAVAMLNAQDWQAAERLVPLVSPAARPLVQARIATQADRAGLDGLILALPQAQRDDAGLALDRFRWRVRKKMPDLARELMRERSTSAESLLDPALWARQRVDYTRALLRDDNPAAAETLAATHYLPPGSTDYADLEFLAGYAALKSGAPDRALAHFTHIADAAASPITLARAHYWTARAHDVAGEASAAQAAYERAAHYQATYYGQLAAEHIGAAPDPALALTGAAVDSLPDWRGSDLRENQVWQAGTWAFAAGYPELGQRFFLHLSETADAQDIGRMARQTIELGHPYYALRLAKRAAAKGEIYPAAYFPLTGLQDFDLGLPTELVLAIARQESEFNHTVGSHAGALGLMQVMPATAEQMARRTGLHYREPRMTRDAPYNARLGGAYLQMLREQFGASIALVAAGYNAGPGRSNQWTARFGDIRTTADPVDWVESIPFDETRNYVMRVAEALAPYRARISGQPVAPTLMQDLTGKGLTVAPSSQQVLTGSARPPRPGAAAAATAEPEATTP